MPARAPRRVFIWEEVNPWRSLRCLPLLVAPQCNHQFVVNLHTIVDVGQEPELKEQLLTGELNRAVCPNCGAGGLLSTPLVYHDPAKELLITYVPAEMGISVDQQEQLVGGLVNAVMNSMPPEGRKGYFFRPTSALTLRSLFDIILEADGVQSRDDRGPTKAH